MYVLTSNNCIIIKNISTKISWKIHFKMSSWILHFLIYCQNIALLETDSDEILIVHLGESKLKAIFKLEGLLGVKTFGVFGLLGFSNEIKLIDLEFFVVRQKWKIEELKTFWVDFVVN